MIKTLIFLTHILNRVEMCQTCLRVLCNIENLMIRADVEHARDKWDWRYDAGRREVDDD